MFLYVFDYDTAHKLMEAGFTMVGNSISNNKEVYMFAYDHKIKFDLDGMKHVFSNTLIF